MSISNIEIAGIPLVWVLLFLTMVFVVGVLWVRGGPR